MGVAKRPTAKPAAKRARRQRIAAGVVAGAPLKSIAASEGITREWAGKEAAAPETRQIVCELLALYHDRLPRLMLAALDAIADGLAANRAVVTKTGSIIDAGADHYARLAAVGRLIKLLSVGRPTAKPLESEGDEDGLPTWDKVLELYRKSRGEVTQ